MTIAKKTDSLRGSFPPTDPCGTGKGSGEKMPSRLLCLQKRDGMFVLMCACGGVTGPVSVPYQRFFAVS